MNDREITILLKKADELRSLFVLGQRVIPFLEEIFVFVSEIQPLLDEINSSIEENLKKMPNASKQLSKVTEATELATTEIMDIVDGVVNKTDIMSKNINDLNDLHKNKVSKATRLLEIMKQGIEKDNTLKDGLTELDIALNDLKEDSEQEENSIISNTNDILQSISMDSSSIMMSLQVQDITSQQIAAVNNLLETIQSKLTNILTKFRNTDLSEIVNDEDAVVDLDDDVSGRKPTNVSKMHRDIAFDPDAVDSITMKNERQSNVDQYMKEHESNENSNKITPTTQDEIDALFNNNQETDTNENIDSADISDEPSPEDIDKLFNGSLDSDSEDNPDNDESDNAPTDDGEISQDDIDKMFNT